MAKDFDQMMEEQEKNTGKVTSEAVVKAKEKMAEQKLEEDARQVQRRLQQSDRDIDEAAKQGRYASKKKNILKNYSEKLQEARTKFEESGNWKAYDEAMSKLDAEKREAIDKAKHDIFGDESWRIRD